MGEITRNSRGGSLGGEISRFYRGARERLDWAWVLMPVLQKLSFDSEEFVIDIPHRFTQD